MAQLLNANDIGNNNMMMDNNDGNDHAEDIPIMDEVNIGSNKVRTIGWCEEQGQELIRLEYDFI